MNGSVLGDICTSARRKQFLTIDSLLCFFCPSPQFPTRLYHIFTKYIWKKLSDETNRRFLAQFVKEIQAIIVDNSCLKWKKWPPTTTWKEMKIKRNALLRFFWGFLLWITDRPDYLKYKKSYSTPSLNIAVVKTKCKHRPTLLFFILQKDDHIWTVVISKWMELLSNGFHHWMELWKFLIFCTKLLKID